MLSYLLAELVVEAGEVLLQQVGGHPRLPAQLHPLAAQSLETKPSLHAAWLKGLQPFQTLFQLPQCRQLLL